MRLQEGKCYTKKLNGLKQTKVKRKSMSYITFTNNYQDIAQTRRRKRDWEQGFAEYTPQVKSSLLVFKLFIGRQTCVLIYCVWLLGAIIMAEFSRYNSLCGPQSPKYLLSDLLHKSQSVSIPDLPDLGWNEI